MLWILLGLLSMPSAAMASADVSQLMAEGEALSEPEPGPPSMQRALVLFEEAKEKAPHDAESCWKASRSAWWLGMQNSKSADKRRYFQEGVALAKQAVERNPHSTEGYYWLGANELFYGHAQGMMSSLKRVPSIRQSMQRVIQQNERYMGGGAYCVLGLLNTYLPSIAGGNKPQALREFNQALAIESQNPLTLCGLASFYVEIGQKDKALITLARLERAQAPIDLEFEMQIMRQEGQKLRKKIH